MKAFLGPIRKAIMDGLKPMEYKQRNGIVALPKTSSAPTLPYDVHLASALGGMDAIRALIAPVLQVPTAPVAATTATQSSMHALISALCQQQAKQGADATANASVAMTRAQKVAAIRKLIVDMNNKNQSQASVFVKDISVSLSAPTNIVPNVAHVSQLSSQYRGSDERKTGSESPSIVEDGVGGRVIVESESTSELGHIEPLAGVSTRVEMPLSEMLSHLTQLVAGVSVKPHNILSNVLSNSPKWYMKTFGTCTLNQGCV